MRSFAFDFLKNKVLKKELFKKLSTLTAFVKKKNSCHINDNNKTPYICCFKRSIISYSRLGDKATILNFNCCKWIHI